MLKKILVYFTLPLLVLVGASWHNSQAQPPEKSTEGQTGTRARMLVVNGNVTLDLDLNRLKGISATQESKRESVRFEVGPNSFFTILAFDDSLRGPEPGSMGLIGGSTASLPEPLSASFSQLAIEKPRSDAHFDLVLRDGKTGFVFFNIEGHLYQYDAAARSLSIKGGRLLISEEFANRLGRPADASAIAGEISIAATVHPIEISTFVNGAVKSAMLPPRARGTPNTPEGSVPGPDIVVGDMNGLQQFGSSGTQVGLATGATSCNNGNVPFHFYLLPNPDHSVVSQNLYRMSGGASNNDRFEQLGYAWNKHTFGAAQEDACGFGCTEFPNQSELGVGCSDPYSASQNGFQGDTDFGALGSRAWINPFTGFFPVSPRPENHAGHVHTGTSHRIAVERDDLNPAMNPGATYYLEVQYDSPHEYNWCQAHPGECNMYNNASYRRYNVSGTTNFTFAAVGSAVRMKPATNAWTGATTATVEPEPGVDGRAFVVYKVTNPSAGVWHYEYAIHNQNLDRSIQSFSVPLGNGITLSNVGFRAPPNHPGFPNDGTVGNAGFSNAAWTSNQTSDAVSWNTETFAQNPNANAIRFGTLYNFRFDSNRPPQAVNATIGFLKTGAPIAVGIQGPSPDGASPTPSPTVTPTPTPTSSPTPTATATPSPSEFPRTDIAVSNADSPDPVQVGQNLTYTITVTNNGPGGASVIMTDNLPASVNFASVTPSQGNCSLFGSEILCDLGNLPVSNSATVILVVTPTVAGPLSNTASTNHPFDLNTGNNSSTVSTTVLPSATPTPTSSPTPTATATATPCCLIDNCFDAEVIPPDGFPHLTSLTLDITNATTLGDPATPPSCQANVSRSLWYTFTPHFSSIYVISSCANAPTGTTVDDTVMAIYTSTGGCNGPFTEIPTGAGIDGCDDDSCATEANQAVITTGLNSGTTYYIVIWKSGAAAPTAGNTAVQLRVTRIGPPTPTPTPTATIPPTPTPTPATPTPTPSPTPTPTPTIIPIDLSIGITDSPDPVLVDQNLTYTITVANNGPGNPTNVMMSDTLPAGVNFVSATPSQGTCSGTSTVTCNLGTLAPFGSASVTLIVTPTVAQLLSNTATAPNPGDPFPGNNSATATTSVLPGGGTPPPATPTPSPTPGPAAQAINLSTRMRVQTGDNVGIGGFIITGSVTKHVLIRAIGPSLSQFGVLNVLADPVLELNGPGSFVTITNNDWRDDPGQEALIEATGIPPTNDLESAIEARLAPGSYTAIVRGNGNTSGVGLVEVYDLNSETDSKLGNISTRAFVSTGDNIVIAGFVLGGDSGDDRIVVRGIGPSLSVPGPLANPTLELRNSNGALLLANNDWQDDPAQAAELTAAELAPTNNLESGMAMTLPPGLYTALLAGVSNGTGIGLVEVYDRGAP